LIDLTFSNDLLPAKGKILLSDPFLDEEYFRRSVIYLCEHNDEGSFGFVLNNLVDLNLHEIEDTFPNVESSISIGGPVEPNSLYFLHSLGDQIINSVSVEEGIYLGGDFQQLTNLVRSDQSLVSQIRFFIGYTGWSKDQLEMEITSNSWVVADFDSAQNLFQAKEELSWKLLMENLGEKFKVIANFPLDPRDN
jgi:putative transcriptional regulator